MRGRSGQAGMFEAFLAVVLIAIMAFVALVVTDILNSGLFDLIPSGSKGIVAVFLPAIAILVLWHIAAGRSEALVR